MFLICNHTIYEKGNFLNLETDPVQFKIDWNWVKAHSTDKLNNEVDLIAREAANL